MVAAALHCVGASAVAQVKISDHDLGVQLAAGLMAEIMQQAYQSPAAPGFGPESGKTTRAQFNDVDDYNGWTESPPQNRDGTVMPNLAGWARSVWVIRASPNSLNSDTGVETGLKGIEVIVSHKGRVVAATYASRTLAP